MTKLLLGIDFGTSTNFVTKYDFIKKDAIPVANMGAFGGGNTFDNCIYIESPEKCRLGDLKRGVTEPLNFFRDIKQFITSDDWKHRVPNLNDEEVSAQQLAQMVFAQIRRKVEENENKAIDGAVITVPYAYGDKYRKRLKDAAENAGIRVIQLIEEPVAAAISFGILSDVVEAVKKEKIVVFDLGGGTFDITVFEFQKNDQQHAKIEVLNTDGVKQLGGKSIDALVAKKLRIELGIEYCDICDKKAERNLRSRLNELANETKEILSDEPSEEIFESFTIDAKNIVLDMELQREDFDGWLVNNNIIGQIETALENVIEDIDLEPEDIDRIVLAGGTSGIPVIKDLVSTFFGKAPESKKDLNELVGHGAGILAGLSEDNTLNYEVIRKTSKAIGIAKGGNKFIKILAKNKQYGEASEKHQFELPNADSKLKVTLYEGDSTKIEDCERVGKVVIDGTLFPSGVAFLSLTRDKNSGRVKYALYDENHTNVAEKFLEEVG